MHARLAVAEQQARAVRRWYVSSRIRLFEQFSLLRAAAFYLLTSNKMNIYTIKVLVGITKRQYALPVSGIVVT